RPAHAERSDCRAAVAVPRGADPARARGSFLPGDRAYSERADRHGHVAPRPRAAAARRVRAGHYPRLTAADREMKPEEAARLLHAYVDRELDAGKSLEVEAQLAADPALRERFERLRDLSAGIREKADYHAAPSSLTARLSAALPGAARWFLPVAAAALVAVLALGIALVRPGDEEALLREMVASHVRSTL